MHVYLLRRLAATLGTLWLVITLTFVALRVLPGDVVREQLMTSGASEAQIAERRAELGLDQPILAQYAALLVGLLHGDPGRSIVSGRRVTDILLEQIGPTLVLAGGALIVALIMGIGLGLTASGANRLISTAALVLITLILSAPVYWMATVAIYVFSVALKLLPSAGGGDLRSLLLPWLSLGLSLAGGIARVTLTSIDETRMADFVRTARSKGLSEGQVLRDHVLRANLGPLVSVIALQSGFLIGGTAITEIVFVRPGLGQVLLNAILSRDYPVVQALVLMGAFSYSAVHFAADALLAVLDPRVRD
ncbi:MAG TPA: ABC transporter permease [Aggregatilineales bacterium]|nr:ABC transporter permease [Aggregatilineales bacterium]